MNLRVIQPGACSFFGIASEKGPRDGNLESTARRGKPAVGQRDGRLIIFEIQSAARVGSRCRRSQ